MLPPLLGTDHVDESLVRDDEHLPPAPLVVHQVGVDGRVPGVGGAHVAVVTQRMLLPDAGGEDLVVLDGPHHTTPTSRSRSRPSGVMSFRDHESHTTSISTSSIPAILRRRSLMSSWIMSIAGQPMQV